MLEMMKGLILLYNKGSACIIANESESSALGVFKKYANPDLIPKEKDAWSNAVREKYVNN